MSSTIARLTSAVWPVRPTDPPALQAHGGVPEAPRRQTRSGTRLLAVVPVTFDLVRGTASTEENEPARVDDAGSTSGSGSQGAQPEVFAVGDLVELGDWRVQVHGVTDPVESTNQFLAPPPATGGWRSTPRSPTRGPSPR